MPLNLNICNADVTLTQCDDDDFVMGGDKHQATIDTLVLKVRDIPGARYFLGFLPEVGIMVLVPDWYFVEESKWSDIETIFKEAYAGTLGQAGSRLGRSSTPPLKRSGRSSTRTRKP